MPHQVANVAIMRLPIRTERLVLRPLRAEDIAAHHRMFSDPDVVRYLYEDVLDLEAATAHLQSRLSVEVPAEGQWLNLAVECDGDLIGEVGARVVSQEHRQCEIGYGFAPEAGGQGFATEAASAIVTLCFDEFGAHRVVGRIDARHHKSARVLERLGMRREAHLRENEFIKGEWIDEMVYAITEGEPRPAIQG